jgi:hypothetical protein
MKDLYLYSEKAQYKMLFSHIIILLWLWYTSTTDFYSGSILLTT